MASGDTLQTFMADDGRAALASGATWDSRNNRSCWDFDATTGESVIFTGVLPRNYAGGGITVYVHWAATAATSGTGGWLVAFERVGAGQQDLDLDGFAADQTVTAATVPSGAGADDTKITNVAVSNGANMDSIAVGEMFRLRVTRDVANDTAAGDLELYAVELKET